MLHRMLPRAMRRSRRDYAQPILHAAVTTDATPQRVCDAIARYAGAPEYEYALFYHAPMRRCQQPRVARAARSKAMRYMLLLFP